MTLLYPEQDNLESCLSDLDTEEVFSIIDKIGTPNIELKSITKDLVEKALGTIITKYGSRGEGSKPFHDGDHTKEAISDAMKVFDLYKEQYPGMLSEDDRLVAIIAATYHDMEQDFGKGHNEKISASMFEKDYYELLKEKNLTHPPLSEGGIALVKAGIHATEFDQRPDVHRQELSSEKITNKQDILERVMALADTAALGRWESQHWRGNRFFWELFSNKYNQADASRKYELAKNWFSGQIGFLERQKNYLEKSFGDVGMQAYPDITRTGVLYEFLVQKLDDLYKQMEDGTISEPDFVDKMNLMLSKKPEDSEQVKFELVKSQENSPKT